MIICCGEGLVDLTPDPIPGGGPMNAAIAVARLGGPAAFVGRISTDEFGDLIWDHLQRNRVDVSAAQRGQEQTATARVEHIPELVFRFEGHDTADTQLSNVDLTPLGDGPHILHGGTLGLFRGPTAGTLANLVEHHNGVVSLDPNVRPQIVADRAGWDHFHNRWLAKTHIYKASDADIEWVWPGRTPDSIAAELLAGESQLVAVTRGSAGATIYTNACEVHVPAVETSVVDTVGAGDTFVGSLLVSLWNLGIADDPNRVAGISRSELASIVSQAAMAASITCSRPGADPPTETELDALSGR